MNAYRPATADDGSYWVLLRRRFASKMAVSGWALARLERAPCQIQRGTKQAANEAIDSLAQMTWRYFKRTGREFIDELVREQNYPGLFYQVVR